ncbi:MAG: fluoride efflux transporter CrcB [Planctomycetota bacterium]
MFAKVLLLAAAGAAGTLTRWGISSAIDKTFGDLLPWGTLAVNTLGCFAAGLLWVLFHDKMPISPDLRLAVFVGFMGAFTTFSALVLESGHLLNGDNMHSAMWYVGLHIVLGFAALFSGLALGKAI